MRRIGGRVSVFGLSCLVLFLSVEGAIGVESFARGFFDQGFVVAEEAIDFVAFVDGDKEDFAFLFAPGVLEVLRGEKDWRCVSEGAAEEHRGGTAFDERHIAAEVEGNR